MYTLCESNKITVLDCSTKNVGICSIEWNRINLGSRWKTFIIGITFKKKDKCALLRGQVGQRDPDYKAMIGRY